MSHFTVMVIGEDYQKQLAPFDENLEIPRYLKLTKQQLIEKEREGIENFKNTTYAKYLNDKVAYEASCKNKSHIDYLENEFPKKLSFTDEQLYAESIKYYTPEEIGADGEVYSTSNPNSKWDWYQVGGRWAGLLKLKDGCESVKQLNPSWGWSQKEIDDLNSQNRSDIAYKKDIENIDEIVCFAILKDGEWYERGKMGWWAFVSNDTPDEVWDNEFKKLVQSLPDNAIITIVDCHI